MLVTAFDDYHTRLYDEQKLLNAGISVACEFLIPKDLKVAEIKSGILFREWCCLIRFRERDEALESRLDILHSEQKEVAVKVRARRAVCDSLNSAARL